jgi:glycosyltransferase involved in cell wall biosynthesis
MKILLSYSRVHFDPDLSPKEHEYWGSSANVLAHSIHDILSKMGTVTYIDPSEYESIQGEQYDLFVGQVKNFKQIIDGCTIGKSIYFAVNMHPNERNVRLREYVRDRKLPASALAETDIVEESTYSESLKAADYIIAVGNIATYNSYTKYGVPRANIKVINYGTGAAETRLPTAKATRFLYVASEIGLRKGFDCVYENAIKAAQSNKDFHLDIVGSPSTEFHRHKLEDLQTRFPTQIRYHGWMTSGSADYQKVLSATTFVLFPTLEEGQAGTVLDAMRAGIIPIVSSATGIDFSPLGWLEPTTSIDEQHALILKAMDLEPTEIARLRRKTIQYYQIYHEQFESALEDAIQGALDDKFYPMFSATLAIFNKEKTIKSLLQHFDRVACAYGRVELHIIFDGCKDATESIVRGFFKDRSDYPLTYEVTPDIFEVKTNNIGLKKSRGKYCMIIQDDNFIYDQGLFFEAATFLDKNPTAAVLGCLAGVNYYPLGATLQGPGQIALSETEVYWRQDATTDPALASKIFQVDACMRGPLIIRRSFMEQHGFLDEAYVPFYNDDTDICFRAAKYGFQVYCMLADVENKSLTVASYGAKRNDFWERTMRTNAKLFYSRWRPSKEKDYASVNRIRLHFTPREQTALNLSRQRDEGKRLVDTIAHDPFGVVRKIIKRFVIRK